jgi:hypothetical protein
MCQHVVVQYTMKHHKYVPASSCTVHDEVSDIKLMFDRVLYNYVLAHISYVSSCTAQL